MPLVPVSASSWQLTGYVLCVLASLYWVASFLVLLLRAYVPAFAILTEYGGRQPPATSKDSAPPTSPHAWIARPLLLVKRSPLGRHRVPRQSAFTGFYISGILTCLVLGCACPLRAPSLALFGFHCVVRCAECMLGRQARAAGEDEVSLFAAVAGCSFYVFAAISSCPFRAVSRQQVDTQGAWCVVDVCVVAAYVSVCVVQVWCHALLRRLRANPLFANDGTTHATRGVHSDSQRAVPPRMDKVWLYRFPQTRPFTWVQEPHYLAEILLYSIQAGIMVTTVPSAFFRRERGRLSLSTRCLDASLMGASVGVLAFTTVNLAMTARQHRCFWLSVNRARAHLAHATATSAVASAAPPPPPEKLPAWLLIPLVY